MTEKVYNIVLTNGQVIALSWNDLATCYNKFRHVNLVDYLFSTVDDTIPDDALDDIAWRALEIEDHYCGCEDEDEAIRMAIHEWKEEHQ